MRKSHTIPMGIVLLFANQNLGAQTNQQQEFARQANNLFSSDMDAFFDWFTAPSSRNLLLLLMGLSFFYFLSMLTLFVLVNKQVFSIKENSLLAILLEDWLAGKEKVLIQTTTEVELEETASEKTLEAAVVQLDVLSMDTESAKLAMG